MGFKMKLVTFKVHTEERIGALLDGKVVDLNSAYALMLKKKGELSPRRKADALLPQCMIGFLEGGAESLAAAEKALAYAKENLDAVGLDEEALVMCQCTSQATGTCSQPRQGLLYRSYLLRPRN